MIKRAIGKLFALLLVLGGLAGFYAFFILQAWYLLYVVFLVFGIGWVWQRFTDHRDWRRRQAARD